MIETFDIRHYKAITSTNDEGRQLLQEGVPEGVVICAEEQTRGRGRMGRRWISKPGNLYFSLLLKPHQPIQSLPQLSFLAAVAVADALQHILPDKKNITLKWPNDVLVNNQKIAGVLLETEPLSSKPNDIAVIMGIGVNVMQAPEQVMYPATCLAEQIDGLYDPNDLLDQCLDQIKYYYNMWLSDGFKPIRNLWMRRAHGLGKEITIGINGRLYDGEFTNIDDSGSLIIFNERGEEESISSAEILFA
jgi:BirA family biotin operon repressor/biotin-[acetyl-CoA-carboxylase] ligase